MDWKTIGKKWIPVVAVVIIVLVVTVFWWRNSHHWFGSNHQLQLYIMQERTGPVASVILDFKQNAGQAMVANVSIDWNNNQTIDDDEWVVRNHALRPEKDLPTRLNFRLPTTTIDTNRDYLVAATVATAKVNAFNDHTHVVDRISTSLSWQKFDISSRVNAGKVTKPAEATLGAGLFSATALIPVAQAATTDTAEPIDVHRNMVPDIDQDFNECMPTAAANNIISLYRENGGKTGDLPRDPKDMIAEMKETMYWTPEDGVLAGDFIAGKTKFVQNHGLPIVTEAIGDGKSNATMEQIVEAMQDGCAVEIRILFASPNGEGGYGLDGAHMISATGVHVVNGETTLMYNDPASPEGTDSNRVENGNVVDYPLHINPVEGAITVVGFAYCQRWITPPFTEGGQLDEEELQGILRSDVAAPGTQPRVQVINYNGQLIPIDQVHQSDPDRCDGVHWHANGGEATDLDGKTAPDPHSNGCGYGKVADVPVEWVPDPRPKK